MILADKLIMLRKKFEYSQEELAERLDVSRQSVSKWESGAATPDLNKLIKIAQLYEVSLDYLVNDEVDDVVYSEYDKDTDSTLRVVSVEEAMTYLEVLEKHGKMIAIAVALFIMSPIALILLAGASESGIIGLSEEQGAAIGLVVLLSMVAIGVGICIMNGLVLGKYEYLEKEVIELAYGVEGNVRKRFDDFMPVRNRRITICVIAYILATLPLIVGSIIFDDDFVAVCGIGILLFIVAISTFVLVNTLTIYGGYAKLLQIDDFTPEKKTANNARVEAVTSAYWMIVTIIYLVLSFQSGRWDKTWIVWMVAGIAFGALKSIISAFAKK